MEDDVDDANPKNERIGAIEKTDSKTNLFRISKAEYVFACDTKSLIYCEGNWYETVTSSFYESEEIAIENIKYEIKDYIYKSYSN